MGQLPDISVEITELSRKEFNDMLGIEQVNRIDSVSSKTLPLCRASTVSLF
eukprot:SAG22_NODE_301_length_12744_cov_19.648189_3_plen_51_part_00